MCTCVREKERYWEENHRIVLAVVDFMLCRYTATAERAPILPSQERSFSRHQTHKHTPRRRGSNGRDGQEGGVPGQCLGGEGDEPFAFPFG